VATNQILPFGGAAGANVLTPAEYGTLPARASGFQSGVAKSKEVNTPLRQTAFVAAMIGQFIADKAFIDVLDDGDVPGLVADFSAAITAQLQSRVASMEQAQALADNTTMITPLRLGQVTALESRQGLVQLASMGQAQALADNTTAITPLRLGQVTALESRQGLVQLASMGQAQALTNDTTAITPLKLARAFEGNSSLGPAGYQKLPGGLIIQWGATPSVASGSFAGVTFPTTFPTAGVQMFATVAATSNLTESYSWATEIFSPSIGRVYHFGSSGQAATYRWFAIGY